MKQENSPIPKLELLLQLAARYQLATSGEFNISRHSGWCEIDNDAFSEVGLQYVSSKRLDFDGGIELEFCGKGELAEILKRYNVTTFTANIYNLHDDSELENYLIEDKEDCDFVNVSISNTFASSTEHKLAAELQDYFDGDKVGTIRSFTALKLGL